MNAQNQNIVSEEMQLGEQVLALKNQLNSIVTRFDNNNTYAESTDQDLAAVPAFAHLTQSKMGNGIATFVAILALLNANNQEHTVALELLKG
jgi:hypothetical protein